MVQFLSI